MKKESGDRVSYSYGMKRGLPNYSSVDFHVSYSTDVRDGETPEKAYKRAKDFVDEKIAEEIEDAEKL